LYVREGHGPEAGVEHRRAGIPDSPQALIHLGHSADDAVFLIRYRRSKWALNNPLFVSYLDTGLDVARLLTGLEA
jgi:hypothetical protein